MMRSFLIASFLCVLSAAVFADPYKIALTQIVDHPSLNKIRAGIVDVLKEKGLDFDLTYDNAHGNISVAMQIAQKMVGMKPDVIIAIATPSAQTMMKALKGHEIPLIFGAVTDPVSAGLLKDLSRPEKGVTGTIDRPSIDAQLSFFREILPSLKVIGVVYNGGEPNVRVQLSALKKKALSFGFSVQERSVQKAADIPDAVRSFEGAVGALLIFNDNLVVSSLESLLKGAASIGVPVLASDPDSVDKGAFAALANDQYQVGRATGELVIKALKGEKNIPSIFVESFERKRKKEKD